MKKRIVKKVYGPEIAVNFTSRYLAEVRLNGWIMNYGYFDTEQVAQLWLTQQDGETMSEKVALMYYDIITNHGR